MNPKRLAPNKPDAGGGATAVGGVMYVKPLAVVYVALGLLGSGR